MSDTDDHLSDSDDYMFEDDYDYFFDMDINFGNFDVNAQSQTHGYEGNDVSFLQYMQGISSQEATSLLCQHNWDMSKLMGGKFPDKDTSKGGLEDSCVSYFNCGSCGKSYPRDVLHAASCGNRFCSECLTGHGRSVLRCPDPCGAVVSTEKIPVKYDDNNADDVNALSSATEIANSIPILSEILSKLAVKAALNFKLASRRFYEEIESEQFAKRRSKTAEQRVFVVSPSVLQGSHNHNDCSASNSYMSFQNTDLVGSTFHHIYPLRPFMYAEILGAVQGVICFVDWMRDNICFLNLTTQELSRWIHHPHLCPDRYCSYHFGFNEKKGSFKVLCLTTSDSSSDSTCWEVLELSGSNFSDSVWKKIDVCDSFKTNRNPSSLYFKSCLYIFSEIKRSYHTMATSYNAPGSILVINLTEDGPNVIPKVIRLPEYVSGLISLHGIDFQKWLRLVEVHNSIGIMRQMSQTELRLCFVKDMTRSIGEASNWKHIDMTLPVMKFPAVHADFFFDVLRGTSELLMESHIQTADGPGHVTLHTISFEEILQDYNYDLARKWNWKPLRIRGQIEEIPNEFYYGCMLSKMVIPFDENLRQLTIRKYNNSGEGESHLPTGVASSICPSEHLVCAMPSTVNMQASETLGPPHTLENERVDGGENPLVNLSPIISEGFRTVSENEKVESGDDGRTKAVNVTAPGGGCVSDCLAPVDGGEDPSVYISPIISEGSGTLSENEQVEFEIESVDDGRTMAVNVTAPGGGSQSSGEYVGSRSGGGYGGGGDL